MFGFKPYNYSSFSKDVLLKDIAASKTSAGGPHPGDRAPSFEARSLDGDRISLSDFEGRRRRRRDRRRQVRRIDDATSHRQLRAFTRDAGGDQVVGAVGVPMLQLKREDEDLARNHQAAPCNAVVNACDACQRSVCAKATSRCNAEEPHPSRAQGQRDRSGAGQRWRRRWRAPQAVAKPAKVSFAGAINSPNCIGLGDLVLVQR